MIDKQFRPDLNTEKTNFAILFIYLEYRYVGYHTRALADIYGTMNAKCLAVIDCHDLGNIGLRAGNFLTILKSYSQPGVPVAPLECSHRVIG